MKVEVVRYVKDEISLPATTVTILQRLMGAEDGASFQVQWFNDKLRGALLALRSTGQFEDAEALEDMQETLSHPHNARIDFTEEDEDAKD